MTEGKPLTPLSDGVVLIVGTKASNFEYSLRTHPRIIMWESQQEHWTNKDMPSNTRAVFMTRFIGHSSFEKIVAEARKKRITIFNPTGTGTIIRQVKELLSITKVPAVRPEPITTETKVKETTVGTKSTLYPLIPFMDFTLTNAENARRLIIKAAELNINTTLDSLNQYVYVQRKKAGIPSVVSRRKPEPVVKKQVVESVDVSIEILDNLIKGLQDMRAFFVATVNENNELRARVDKFKKAMEGI